MARLADGDRSAFEPVFSILRPLLTSFAGRLSDNFGDAEDAAQHALLKVFEHAHRYDPARDAAAWALAITANECHASRRRKRHTASLDGIDEPIAASAAGPEAVAIDKDLIAAATEALGGLRSEDAETLAAAWRGERPSIAAAAFRKRVQRATERLRAAWRSRHGTP